jgi:hypothetical protein
VGAALDEPEARPAAGAALDEPEARSAVGAALDEPEARSAVGEQRPEPRPTAGGTKPDARATKRESAPDVHRVGAGDGEAERVTRVPPPEAMFTLRRRSSIRSVWRLVCGHEICFT